MGKMILGEAMLALSNAVERPTERQAYYKLTNSAGRNVINLSGFIGWWDDEALWLKNYLSERDNEDVEIVISSAGGDVFTGQSMHNAIRAHNGKVTAYVEQAFSIASHIAMACDVVNVVKGGQMMVHAVSGWCGGTVDDIRSYADMVENAGTAIAGSYVQKTDKDLSYWLDIMSNEAGKYFSDKECLEIGLASAIIEPSAMTNLAPDEGMTSVDNTPPVNEENTQENNQVDKELERQIEIRQLFNSLQVRLGLPLNLLNEALDDDKCCLNSASIKFSNYTAPAAEDTDPKRGVINFGNGYQGAGSDAKTMVKAVLLNRAGGAELKEEFKKYAGMDLQNAARELGVQGYGQSIAQNALDSTDFKAVIGEVTQEIVQIEASGLEPLFKKFCKTTFKSRLGEYGVTDFNEITGFGARDKAGNFPEFGFNGKPKRTGTIVEGGLRVILTRAAILNDTFEVTTDLARQAVRDAYRAADKKMFSRLIALGQEVTGADLQALVEVMQITLQERVTSNGDDLGYKGGIIMASPTDINTIKPICGTKTLAINVINPAYDAFNDFQTTMRAGGFVFGFAQGQTALEVALLHGRETPELIENNSIDRANGIGWTVVFDNDIQVCNAQAVVIGKVSVAA